MPQEALWYVGDEAKRDPKKNWPQTGKLKFDQVSLVYRPGLAPAVKNASFEIQYVPLWLLFAYCHSLTLA